MICGFEKSSKISSFSTNFRHQDGEQTASLKNVVARVARGEGTMFSLLQAAGSVPLPSRSTHNYHVFTCISIYIYNYVGLYIMHYIVIQRRFSSLFSAQIRPAKALIWPCEPMPRCGRISDRQEDGRIWNAYGMLSIISLWQRLRWHHSPSNTKHTPWIKSRREFTEFTFHTDILVVLCCIMLYSDSDSCPVDSALDHWRRLYWSFDIKWYRLYW